VAPAALDSLAQHVDQARRLQTTGELFDAVISDDTAGVVASIAAGADVNALSTDEAGEPHTPLTLAVEASQLASVRVLLAHGARVLAVGESYPPLCCVDWRSGGEEALEVAREIIAAGGDATEIGPDGGSALHAAAGAGCVAGVKLLLGAGANPDVFPRNRISPLHFAAGASPATADIVSVVQTLLAAGADPNSCSTNGYTPMHWFMYHQPLAAVEEGIRLLVDAGADPNKATKYGESPLSLAFAHPVVAPEPRSLSAALSVGATPPAGMWTNPRLMAMPPAVRAGLLADWAYSKRVAMLRLRLAALGRPGADDCADDPARAPATPEHGRAVGPGQWRAEASLAAGRHNF
jgi:ankyrin repeat protein